MVGIPAENAIGKASLQVTGKYAVEAAGENGVIDQVPFCAQYAEVQRITLCIYGLSACKMDK